MNNHDAPSVRHEPSRILLMRQKSRVQRSRSALVGKSFITSPDKNNVK